MGWRIRYRKETVAFLKRLSARDKSNIICQLERLAENPDRKDLDLKRLISRVGWRLRVGRYRVIFERRKDQLVILVIRIRARGDVYKGPK